MSEQDQQPSSQRQRLVLNMVRAVTIGSAIFCGYLAITATTSHMTVTLQSEIISPSESDTVLAVSSRVIETERTATSILAAYARAMSDEDSGTLLNLVTGPMKQEILAAGTMGLKLSKNFLSTIQVDTFHHKDSLSVDVRIYAYDHERRDGFPAGKFVGGLASIVSDGSSWKLNELEWGDHDHFRTTYYHGPRPTRARTVMEFRELIDGKSRAEIEMLIGRGETHIPEIGGLRELVRGDRQPFYSETQILSMELKLAREQGIENSIYRYSVPVVSNYGRAYFPELRYANNGTVVHLSYYDIPPGAFSKWPHEIVIAPMVETNVGTLSEGEIRARREIEGRDTRPRYTTFDTPPAMPLGAVRVSHPDGATLEWGPVSGAAGYGIRRHARARKGGGTTASYLNYETRDSTVKNRAQSVEPGWYSVVAFDTYHKETSINFKISMPPLPEAPYLRNWNFNRSAGQLVSIFCHSFQKYRISGHVGRRAISDMALIRFTESGDTITLAARQYPWEGPVDTPPIFYGHLQDWPKTSFIACRAEDLEGNEFLSGAHIIPPPEIVQPRLVPEKPVVDTAEGASNVSPRNPLIVGVVSLLIFSFTFYRPRGFGE